MERFVVIKTGALVEGREAAAKGASETWGTLDTWERRLLGAFVEAREFDGYDYSNIQPGQVRGLSGIVKVAS
jgi:hypothetical protein